jgi:WD40 repeat protein
LHTVRTAPASWIELSPDGSALLAMRPDRTEIWDLRTGKRLLRRGIGDPGEAAFSRDGRHAILGASGPAEVISLPDLRSVRPEPDVLRPDATEQRSADGRFVLSFDATPPAVVSTLTGETVAELRGPGLEARAVSFIADGAGVVTTDEHGIHLWEPPRWTAVRTEPEGQLESENLLLGGAGSRLTLMHLGGSRARAWGLGLDGPRFTVDRTRPALSGRSFGLSANGRFVLTADAHGRTTIRDVATGRPVSRLRAPSKATTPSYVMELPVSVPTAGAVSDDGRIAVADLGDRFIVWDTATGRELPAPDEPAIPPVLLSPDGRRIVASVQDPLFTDPGRSRSILRLLDARTGRLLRDLPQAGGMVSGSFARDGRFATVGYDLRVRLWSSDGLPLRVLSSGDQVTAAAFDPTGRYLAAAGKRGVHVWDARSGAPIATLPLASDAEGSEDDRPAAVVWLGRTIVLANPNGVVRALECVVCRPVAELVAVAEAQLPRQLTAAERRTYLQKP